MRQMDCHNFTRQEVNTIFYARVATTAISFAACLAALVLLCILVCCLRIWKTFVHRLKLYLSAVALVLSVLYLLQVLPMKLGSPGLWSSGKLAGLCKLIGFSIMYVDWVMLLFICWLVLYLLSLARCIERPLVLYRSSHQILFEVSVIALTFIFPLLFVWIPFVTDSYGAGESQWCGVVIIRLGSCNNTENVRRGLGTLIGIWYLPTAVVTLFCTVGVVVVVSFFWRHYKKKGLTHQMITAIIKGILPAVYLLLYISINCIDISSLIYHATNRGNWKQRTDYHLATTHAVTGPSRALIVPFAFVLSQTLIQCCSVKLRKKHSSYTSLQ